MFFILLLSEQFAFDGSPYLIVAFVLNAITMALPWQLPFMIRGDGQVGCCDWFGQRRITGCLARTERVALYRGRLHWHLRVFIWMGTAVAFQNDIIRRTTVGISPKDADSTCRTFDRCHSDYFRIG